MNILVAGATGKTGLRLIKELKSRGHTPIALVRESSETSGLPSGVTQRRGDLTDLPEDVCADCEVIVFAAGSGGNTSEEMTNKVDRGGAIKLVDLAAKASVKRFVMLSTVGAENPPAESKLRNYLEAKHDADEHLKSSGLVYAIVRPVSLTDDDGNRDIIYGDAVDENGKAARGDVAAVLANAIDDAEWANEVKLMESKRH